MIRAVLFDMDGILCDSEKYYMEGTIAQMRAFGFTGKDEEIYPIIGTTMDETYRILYNLLKGRVSVEQLRESNESYFTKLHPVSYRDIMFDGVPEALEALAAMGIRMAVCSSSPMKTIMDSLQAMEISQYFDAVECSDEAEHPKPWPDVYLNAQRKLGVQKEECIVYEDSAAGIEAGKRAGIFTIARIDSRYSQDQSHADLQVTRIQELVEWIRKENHYAGSHED